VHTVESVDQLRDLIRGWDGSPPPAERAVEAEREARRRCRERVEEMQAQTEAAVRAALERQVDAARRRLRRELARTLLCLGSGDLNETFKALVQRETSPDGRYSSIRCWACPAA
jgi:enoyl-CoA hydratase/carnithine racemase